MKPKDPAAKYKTKRHNDRMERLWREGKELEHTSQGNNRPDRLDFKGNIQDWVNTRRYLGNQPIGDFHDEFYFREAPNQPKEHVKPATPKKEGKTKLTVCNDGHKVEIREDEGSTGYRTDTIHVKYSNNDGTEVKVVLPMYEFIYAIKGAISKQL